MRAARSPSSSVFVRDANPPRPDKEPGVTVSIPRICGCLGARTSARLGVESGVRRRLFLFSLLSTSTFLDHQWEPRFS